MTRTTDTMALARQARAHRDRMIGLLVLRLLRRLSAAFAGRRTRGVARPGYRLG